MNKLVLILSALILWLALPGCAVLQGDDPAWNPDSNEGVAALAASRLNSDSMTARCILSVNVDNGMATLYGTVPDQVTRQRALQIVEGTPGIFDVLDRTRMR